MGHSSPKSIEHYLASASHHRPQESIFHGILESEVTQISAPEKVST
jgi:hypothetical protein